MFGKRKSSNDRFVMAKGRDVGNIKKPNQKASAPASPKTSIKVPPAMHNPRKSLGKQDL